MDNEGGFLGHVQVPQSGGVDELCAGRVSLCVEQQLYTESRANHCTVEAQSGE